MQFYVSEFAGFKIIYMSIYKKALVSLTARGVKALAESSAMDARYLGGNLFPKTARQKPITEPIQEDEEPEQVVNQGFVLLLFFSVVTIF